MFGDKLSMAKQYTEDDKARAIMEVIRRCSLRDSDTLEDIFEAIQHLDTNDKECALALVELNVKDTLDEQEQFVLKCYLRKINDNLTERAHLVSRLVQLTKQIASQ